MSAKILIPVVMASMLVGAVSRGCVGPRYRIQRQSDAVTLRVNEWTGETWILILSGERRWARVPEEHER